MNLGWACWSTQPGVFSVGRCIRIETMFPWPALHHGRENIRSWLDRQKPLQAQGREGPVRMNDAIKIAVKEHGDGEMIVWPIDKRGLPRRWLDPDDNVWRDLLRDLRRHVAHNLLCGVRLDWMPGDGSMEHIQTVPSLLGRKGFWGWQRGEKEPTQKITRSLNKEIACQIAGFKPRSMVGHSQGAVSWP